MNKKWLWLIAAMVVLSFSGGFFLFRYFNLNTKFEITQPHMGSIEEAIYGLGTVRSAKIYEHKLGFQATITKLHVEAGDQVKAGQLLLELQDYPALRAPFTGTVTLLPFHEHENVFPQTTLLRLEDLNSLHIEVALEQQGALRIHPGQTARLSFESMRGTIYHGQVETVYPSAGEFLVRISPKDLPKEILPGMTTDVAIEVASQKQALLIPANAVSGGRVTMLVNKKRIRQEVTIGANDGDWVEVLSGNLKESDQILVPKK